MAAHDLYKGKYAIAFYDKSGENFKHIFDNVRDILIFQKKEVSKQNINLINVEIYRALKTETHFIRFLTGEIMRVYLIDLTEDIEKE